MWSDTVHKYEDARIIFTDTETSNWTWDEQAQAYFWHRFFSHQPDLNYDNPEVQEAMLEVLRFWLDLGLDGFRLDAVPYLFEREGTNGENLPETHEYLRARPRRDRRELPRPRAARRGQPVAGRRRRVLRRRRRVPHGLPLPGHAAHVHGGAARGGRRRSTRSSPRRRAIPENCQWGLFLRNHDELTLEMVTDEERDYMYAEYAKDPRMKINVGIRKRLAPLLDNGRDEIELMNAILFSLPGSPVLYYGDEIAMGDNVFLGDRDGVRTPMQWTGDRNGGFSRADFAQLYAPPLMDPVYGYQAVNVEAQLRHSTSLLRWMRRFIALRKEHPVFGLGTYEPLTPSNPRIFAHIRRYEDDVDAVRAQPRALGPGRRARPLRVRGPLPGRAVRALALPAHRRAALPADARAARLLLVPARRAGARAADRRVRRPSSRGGAPMSDLLAPLDEEALREWFVRAALVRLEGPEVAHLNVLEAVHAARRDRRSSCWR